MLKPVLNLVLMLVLLLTSAALYAQEHQPKSYYRPIDGKAMTERKMDSTLTVLKEQIEKREGKKFIPDKVVMTKVEKDDSIIYTVRYRMRDVAIYKSYITQANLIGTALPDFTLKGLNDSIVNLSDYRGKALVVNMWFTACSACVKEMPELNKIKQMPKYADVIFLAISPESKAKVETFLAKREFDFIHLVDAKKYIHKFTHAFPINVFVDKNGFIADMQSGLPIEKVTDKTSEMSMYDTSGFIETLDKIK